MKKRFGLIIPKKRKESGRDITKQKVFSSEDDHVEDDGKYDERKAVNERVCQQQMEYARSEDMKLQFAQALEEDETVFQYDEVYDSMKREGQLRVQAKNEEKSGRESKYIGALLKSAERRQMDFELSLERKAAKELEQDKGKYGETEKFVTSAYKKRLVEMKKWEQREKLEEAIEQKKRQRKDLTGFYGNLLKKNVAFGTAESTLSKEEEKPQSNKSDEKEDEKQKEDVKEEEEREVTIKLQRRNDETSILSARERYLQRKREQQQEDK